MLRLLCKPTSLRSLGDLGRTLAEYFSSQYESRFIDIRRKKNHTFIVSANCGLKTAGDRKIAPAALVRRAIHPMHAHLTHNGIGLNFSNCQLCLEFDV